jgi:hypothetical protein
VGFERFDGAPVGDRSLRELRAARRREHTAGAQSHWIHPPARFQCNSVEGKLATFLYEAAGVAYHYDFTNNRSYFEFGIRYDFRLPLALTGKTGVRINSGESPVYDWEARLVYSLKESFVFGGGATGHEIEGNKLFIGVQSTMTLFTN